MLAESIQQGRYLEQEDPRVPQILARRDHLGRFRAVGFLDKAGQRLRRRGVYCRTLGQFQIAIARLGTGGQDAECHQLALIRSRNSG